MSKSRSLSELDPETVKRWKKQHMSEFADRPDLKEINDKVHDAERIKAALKLGKGVRERGETLERQLIISRGPGFVEAEKRYECPKCHRKTNKRELNYMKKGKDKVPWCFTCRLEIYPEGDQRIKHTIFPVEDNGFNVTFKRP